MLTKHSRRKDARYPQQVLLTLACAYIIFFFNDTATTEIYTLSLHDALPIYGAEGGVGPLDNHAGRVKRPLVVADRKSTRLNSSHDQISYAVFCLKKKQHRFVFVLSLGYNKPCVNVWAQTTPD